MENIMIDSNKNLKIIDFGFACATQNKNPMGQLKLV